MHLSMLTMQIVCIVEKKFVFTLAVKIFYFDIFYKKYLDFFIFYKKKWGWGGTHLMVRP